jgi:G3E family GTPase
MSHPYLLLRYRLDGVVTVVDAVNGEATLDAHFEAVKQAAVADRIVWQKLISLTRRNANGYWLACARSTPRRRSSIQPKARRCPIDFSEAGFTTGQKNSGRQKVACLPRLIPMRTIITTTTSIGTMTTSVLSS